LISNNNTLTAERLIHLQQLTAKGNQKAFEQLYRLHKDRVYEIALAYTGSAFLAEEILQDIFVQVWTKRTGLTEITDFSAWLFILTRNRSFNVLRGIARAGVRDQEMVHYLPQTSDAADSRLLSADIENLVQEAMQLLTPAQRRAFELFKLNGLSREETAFTMGISPNTAKVHVMQAMRIIRAYLVGKQAFLPVIFLLVQLFYKKFLFF
jgi:RNA polymerase sigma-70 factor (family 1)